MYVFKVDRSDLGTLLLQGIGSGYAGMFIAVDLGFRAKPWGEVNTRLIRIPTRRQIWEEWAVLVCQECLFLLSTMALPVEGALVLGHWLARKQASGTRRMVSACARNKRKGISNKCYTKERISLNICCWNVITLLDREASSRPEWRTALLTRELQ